MTLPTEAIEYTERIRSEREAIRHHVRAIETALAILRGRSSDPQTVRKQADLIETRIARLAARVGAIEHHREQAEAILITLAERELVPALEASVRDTEPAPVPERCPACEAPTGSIDCESCGVYAKGANS